MKILITLMILYVNTLLAQSESFIIENEAIFNSSVYIEIAGNPKNPAIVLVHGLGDEASSIWKKSIELLEKDYFVVTFDLPGFGKSSKENLLYSPLNYAKFIKNIAQIYVKKPFHLMGHSMGGAIALKYTHMYKEDVLSLVLVDAAGILNKFAYSKFLTHSGINRFFDEQASVLKGLQTHKFDKFIDKMTDKFDSKMTLDIDTVLSSEELRSVVLGGNPITIAAVALVQSNFNTIPQEIKTKTLIIWGEEDDIAPIQTGYVLYKLLKNVSFKIIPRANHVPMLSHEKLFFKYLFEHLHSKEMYMKKEFFFKKEAYTLKIRNVNDAVYSGTIKSITIRDSRKITLKDALIEEMFIVNSDVEIINSQFKGQKELSLTIQNSSVSIIASDIFGNIKLYNSKLNLAGVIMDSQHKPIEAITRSTVIFSLSDINGNLVHGREILGH